MRTQRIFPLSQDTVSTLSYVYMRAARMLSELFEKSFAVSLGKLQHACRASRMVDISGSVALGVLCDP